MATDDKPGPPPRPEKKRVVTQLARPFFFTPSGEKVELSMDALGGASGTVDAAALDAEDANGDLSAGEMRAVYAAEGIQVAVDFGARPRVARKPERGAAPSPVASSPDAATSDSVSPAASAHAVTPPEAALAPPAAPSSAPPTAPHAEAPPVAPSAPRADIPPVAPSTALPELPSTAPSTPLAELPSAASAPPAPAPAPLPPRREPEPVAAAPRPVAPPPRYEAPPPARGATSGDGDADADDELERAAAAQVEIRSEEIDEILSAMPGGLLRWGTTAVFLTLTVLLAISWFIAYPDVVKGRVALTTGSPPVRLVARQAGEVDRVFTEDGARTTAGQPLVLLKNPAVYADVQALAGILDRMEPALRRAGPLPEIDPGRPLSLGTLQTPYSALLQAHADYRLARDEAFFLQRLAAARAQVADLERMSAQLAAQQTLLEQQLSIAERTHARARQLAERGMAAVADVEQAEAAHLSRRLEVENGRGALTNNQVALNAQRAALVDLEQRRSDEGERGLVALRGAHASLRAALSSWEQENVLRAPVTGTVTFFRELRENQAVTASEALVAVVPDGDGLVGRVTLSGMGAGKVEPGQRVIIRLDGFPYRDFGTLSGRVERVSQLGFQQDARAPEVAYLAEVALPDGLVTSYGRTLAFRQEMTGEVDVVTEEMRLLERIFNKLRTLKGNE